MTSTVPTDDAAAPALPASVVRFAYVVAAVGLSVAGSAAWILRTEGPARAEDLLFAFLVVALSAAVGIDFSLRDTGRSITMDEIGFAATLLLLPPTHAIAVVLTGSLAEQVLRRRGVLKTIFNVGEAGLSMTPAVLLVHLSGLEGFSAARVSVVLAAVLLNGAINMAAFAGIASRMSGTPTATILRQELGHSLVSATAAAAIGVLAAFLWTEHRVLLPFLIAPALLARTNTAARREAAEALAAERDRLSRAIEGVTDGVALVDPSGHVVVCNDSFVRISGGLGAGAGIAGLLGPLRPVPTDPELASDPRVTRFEGEVHDRTVRLVRHVTYEGGRATGEVVQLQDVTIQRELEQLREDFVSRVSHELRTPLTAINGTVDTLLARGEALGVEQRVLLLESAKRNGRRLQRLVSTLLMRARIEGPAVDVSTSRIELGSLVAEMLEEIDAPGAAMRIPADLTVEVDADHLLQMLENLVTNAVRYGAPPIEISAERAATGRVLVRVSDHGPGIPADFRERMFHPFTQASTGTRRQAQGLGLGLDIVRSLAVANGGAVRYEPTADGASFVLDLPSPTPSGTGQPAVSARG